MGRLCTRKHISNSTKSHGPTGLPNVQVDLGRCFLIRFVTLIRNVNRFATNGAQSGQSGTTQPFDKFTIA